LGGGGGGGGGGFIKTPGVGGLWVFFIVFLK